MKHAQNILLTSAFALLAGGSLFSNLYAAALTADEIANKSYMTSKVADSTSDAVFKLTNANGQERVRETVGQSKLVAGSTENRRLVTFLSPSDVKGTKTLMIEHAGKDDDIWIYLPALKKVRRLVASNKKDSFVGTDFSYGDVIGHRPEDWTHTLLREEKVEGKDCYVLESTPKTKDIAENSGYGKRTSWIDKESFVALKGEAFDTSAQLSKKFTAKNIVNVDTKAAKWQPMLIEAENVQTGHRTSIEFKNYQVNTGIADELFTARSLEK